MHANHFNNLARGIDHTTIVVMIKGHHEETAILGGPTQKATPILSGSEGLGVRDLRSVGPSLRRAKNPQPLLEFGGRQRDTTFAKVRPGCTGLARVPDTDAGLQIISRI